MVVRADLVRDADVLAVAKRASGVRVRRLARGGPRDRQGHHPHLVGGGCPDARGR